MQLSIEINTAALPRITNAEVTLCAYLCALCTNNTAYIIMLHPLINRSNINRDNRDNAVVRAFRATSIGSRRLTREYVADTIPRAHAFQPTKRETCC